MKRFRVRDLIDTGYLQINDGYRAKNEELGRPGLPFARAANIDGELTLDSDAGDCLAQKNVPLAGSKLSRSGDVVLTTKGSVGRVAFVRESYPPFVYSPQLSFWRVTNQSIVNPRYLYFWMRGKEAHDQLVALKGQTDMADYVSLVDQRNMTLSLPPIGEQDAIAAVLGALDDKIGVNRRLAAQLERVFRGAFRQWMATRDNSWRRGRLGEVAARVTQAISPADVDPSTPYVGLEHMPRGSITLWNQGVVSDAVSGKLAFNSGDILFGKLRAYFKKVVVVATNGLCSSDILVVRAASGWLSFALGHLASDELIEYADQRSGGTRMPRATWADIASYPVWLPPTSTAEALETTLRPVLTMIQHFVMESRITTELRDVLLPRLISGAIHPSETALRAIP